MGQCHTRMVGIQKELTAKQAVQVAEQYAKDTIETLNIGRSNPDYAPVLAELQDLMSTDSPDAFHRGRVMLAQMSAVDDTFARLSGICVQTALAVRLWRRHRVVYRVHPGLAESLLATDTTAEVPCEVFARLPHPDPFVVFPTPLPAPVVVDGMPLVTPPEFVGMLVTAQTANEAFCSTADPRATQLHISLASRIHYVGAHPSHDESIVFVPLSGTYSIDGLIARAAEYDRLGGTLAAEDERRVHNLAMSLLLYLCSGTRDAREHQPEHPGRSRKDRRKEPKTVIDLGFDIGPALTAARTDSPDRATGPGSGSGSGEGVRAHLRRAHWHTYWTGPRTDTRSAVAPPDPGQPQGLPGPPHSGRRRRSRTGIRPRRVVPSTSVYQPGVPARVSRSIDSRHRIFCASGRFEASSSRSLSARCENLIGGKRNLPPLTTPRFVQGYSSQLGRGASAHVGLAELARITRLPRD